MSRVDAPALAAVVVAAPEADKAAPAALPDAWWDPARDGGGNCRPVGEHSGYTLLHLPRFRLGKMAVATPAIFAARIARSSLLSRWRLK